MGKYDSPENVPREAKCLVPLRKKSFQGSDFLSVELVEGTSVITGPK